MRRKANISSIPALREGTQWLTDAKSKANAFAKVFSSKAHLPEEVIDTPFFGKPNEKIYSLGFKPKFNLSDIFKKDF